jgi:hypothetical protein
MFFFLLSLDFLSHSSWELNFCVVLNYLRFIDCESLIFCVVFRVQFIVYATFGIENSFSLSFSVSSMCELMMGRVGDVGFNRNVEELS